MNYTPNIPKKAVMIDCETLDKRPGSVILSFAGLTFNPLGEKSELVDGDKVIAPNINLVLEYKTGQANRSTSPSTIKWWEQQSVEAKSSVFSDKILRVDYTEGIRRFVDWMAAQARNGAEAIFACSPRFDVGILENAMEDVYGKDEKGEYRALPIPFYKEIDVRTLRGFVFGNRKLDWGTKHEALGDCVRQALEMQEVYKWRLTR
jgi:hypothetical protein